MKKKMFSAEDPVVHHINGDHNDNRPSNLMCLTRRDHVLLHHAQKDIFPNSKDKKKEVLKFLKKNGRSATNKIGCLIKSDMVRINRYLNELEQENKIKKEVKTQGTYWILNTIRREEKENARTNRTQ